MGKVIQLKFAAATMTKPKRCIAHCDSAKVEHVWNYDLTDSANYRAAANALLFEINSEPHNAIHKIKYQIVAGGMMPDGNSYIYIMED